MAQLHDERCDQERARVAAPGGDFELLEEAARSRSEADWIVGMNATRAATIRLRSSFDGAVSLGRVQTPTLAIVTRREEEIKAFTPEPYWLVDARFRADEEGARSYVGHYQAPIGNAALRKGESRQRLFDERPPGGGGRLPRPGRARSASSRRRSAVRRPSRSTT